jgi:nitrite reductase/ring-hydroxylating ferredoxin subunit/alkylhydroperoxidase/carboxymuconolactone decarboxylase family protein YurZ
VSDALAFLIKARPQEMASYFAFMKSAGRRLDPKTRNLISVITKVHAQTEGGLRQYLKRALREGASADEVIDALMMAFPALGLTKIVWAIDVILGMQLPEFDLERLERHAGEAVDAEWHDVGAASALADQSAARYDIAGRGVFVYREGSRIAVYDARCPHQSTDIPEVAIDGRRLVCPKHAWTFDLASGECVANGDAPLNELPHRIENGRVLVLC